MKAILEVLRPEGFPLIALIENLAHIQQWKGLFEPYLIHMFVKGYSGADIRPLMDQDLVLAGLRPDSQRYFDHHHAENDTFEHVNKRELQLGGGYYGQFGVFD